MFPTIVAGASAVLPAASPLPCRRRVTVISSGTRAAVLARSSSASARSPVSNVATPIWTANGSGALARTPVTGSPIAAKIAFAIRLTASIGVSGRTHGDDVVAPAADDVSAPDLLADDPLERAQDVIAGLLSVLRVDLAEPDDIATTTGCRARIGPHERSRA